MKLTKAIEIVEQRIDKHHLSWNAEDFKALRLSIEAMKAVKLEREIYAFERIDTLPGETKE